MRWLVSFLTVMVAFNGAMAGMFSNTNVIQLNAKNFKKEVLRNDNVTAVVFYAPWCGYCKALTPEYIKSANSLNGIVRVGAVNCDAPSNKGLCAHYGVEGFPTIKVFQPAKKTDLDFKDAVEGKTLKKKPHKVFNYNGPREAKAINKYAISKLRNYAATLEGTTSFLWLKANGIPRVIMLPGSKYKSKTIAPLFKALSNEYFGTVRFAYIPRRVDGAWNLLGIKAPEDSQVVYMSDDKGSVVYQGKLTKKAVKTFIDEQYELEMARREARGDPLRPERDVAADGFEYIIEDQQEGELEHVIKAREEYAEEQRIFDENKRRVRERKAREKAEAEGKEYVPEPETVEEVDETKESDAAVKEDVVDKHAVVDPDLIDIGDFEGDSGSESDEEIEEAVVDDQDADEVSIDGGDDAMEEEILLDEVDIELAPDEIVDEGPEAVAAWREKVLKEQEEARSRKQAEDEIRASIRAERAALSQDASETKTAGSALPPGITPRPNAEAPAEEDPRLKDIDSIVRNCIRRERICLLLSTTEGFRMADIHVLLHARQRIPGAVNEKLLYQYFVDSNEHLEEVAGDLGYLPYSGSRRTPEGVEEHNPKLAIFDYSRRDMAFFDDDYTSTNIVEFMVKFLERRKKKTGLSVSKIPKKFLLWVTEEDLDIMDRHDEL